jgi:hypothetical protein
VHVTGAALPQGAHSRGSILVRQLACREVRHGPPPVAHVYIQTPRGVTLYNTSPTGQLTLVPGSPFRTIGLMVGANGKDFVSNGTNNVDVYAMSSNGAIGKYISNINTAHHSGAECGTTGASVLDHTGQTLYVQRHKRRQLRLLCLPVVQD